MKMKRQGLLIFLFILLIPQYSYAATPANVKGFVELGDITGDGVVDAIIAKNNYSLIGVMLGDSAGGFGSGGILETYDATDNVTYIQLIDSYSGDNFKNLLIGTSTSKLTVAPIAQNEPRMDTETTLSSTAPYNFIHRDINNDGISDIINQKGSVLELSLGITDTTFSTPTLIANNTYIPVDVADIDADGFEDLLLQASSNNIAIFYGDGTGSFTPAANLLTGVALQFTHMNADNLWDIASIFTDSSGNKNFEFILGSSTQFFPSRVQTTLPYFDTDSAMADLNQDGYSDLVQVASGANSLYVFHGDGTGSFAGRVEYVFLDVNKAIDKIDEEVASESGGCFSYQANLLFLLFFFIFINLLSLIKNNSTFVKQKKNSQYPT